MIEKHGVGLEERIYSHSKGVGTGQKLVGGGPAPLLPTPMHRLGNVQD